MNTYDLLMNRRSIRKFKQSRIDPQILAQLADVARMAPTGANLQPLKLKIVDEAETNSKIFAHIKWAGYLAPNGAPQAGQEPTAYICLFIDTNIKQRGDYAEIGAAAQSIMMLAESYGIGTCWLGAINRDEIVKILNVSDRYYLHTIIALGHKDQISVAEDIKDDVKYYEDENKVLHVPKRRLEDVLL